MRNKYKKILAATAITTLMVTSLVGCSGEAGTDSGEIPTLELMIPSHPSFPWQENWEIMGYIEEGTNTNLKVDSILNSGSSFDEKLNLTMISDDLPDLIYPINNNIIKRFGDDGAFVNILDHLDQLPNFAKWYEENKESVVSYLSADGSLYQFPSIGMQESNRRGWMYREDVFAEHNLEVPTDEESLYTVLKELKVLYPDSYPLSFRSELNQFQMIAPSWGTDHFADNRHMYLDENNEFQFGPIEDEFKEMLIFYNKLYEEELLVPNFLTLDTTGWQEIISTEQAFITIDYLSRIDFFNTPMREENPEFTLSYMAPPAGGTNGTAMFPDARVGFYGYILPTGTDNLDATLAYCDWWYTEEAKELTSWGKEGETFEVVDGKKQWIDYASSTDVKVETGFATYGFYMDYDFEAQLSLFTEETKSAYEQAAKYDLKMQPIPAFNEEEQKIVETKVSNIATFVEENMSNFIIGKKDFNEWDAYVAEIEAMGLADMKKIYTDAYGRMTTE